MGDTSQKRYVIIHGHFYQPPRENPWTGRIDRQESAAPYHDWNERICLECYLPNARSRRLDGFGRVLKLVNNYESISFNFGPTLLSWIEEKYPDLHSQIVDADRASAARNNGHGNAIAQVYNHVIMPLAGRRDQKTQILWGVHDFERRFGRRPEGIWLAETAINEPTLELLMDHGFRFLILSPFQADRLRPIGGEAGWKNAGDGRIPCGMPYRCFGARHKGKRRRDRFIDIFFYDAPLSTDVSFNHLLSSGDKLADSLDAGFARCGGDLVTVATDGEIYGHHEPFGDMALAYLIDKAADAHGFTLTNFGAYLDSHEPVFEVQIKQGEKGEGTAWSCSHGVGRWKEDCGCSTGAAAGWNQKWRDPLRRGLDSLRDGLAVVFESEAGRLLVDPWKTRDEYIAVAGNRPSAGTSARVRERASFIRDRASRPLSDEELSTAASLLESQRNALLMYTSCGWFFSDISGIETVKLMEYAARAVELAGSVDVGWLETSFLGTLDEARSNIPAQGTGKTLYLASKKFSSVEPSFLAGQHALALCLDSREASPASFGHLFDDLDSLSVELGKTSIRLGRFAMTDYSTLARREYQYLVTLGEPSKVTCFIRDFFSLDDYERAKERFGTMPPDIERAAVLRSATDHFGGRVFSIRDLLREDKEIILEKLAFRQTAAVLGQFNDIYLENRDLLRFFSETSLAMPESLLVPARAVLAERLREEVGKWERSLDNTSLGGIHGVISEAGYYGVKIDSTGIAALFAEFFLEKLHRLREGLSADICDHLHVFAEYSYGIGIEMRQHEIQNELFNIMETRGEEAILALKQSSPIDWDSVEAVDSLLRLARRFNFNTDQWQERLPKYSDDIV